MDDKRRLEIEAVFDELVDLPESERTAALRRRCASDLDLAAEVRALLEAHEIAERIFPDAPTGRMVGPYRIVREIGRGGMGVVYLADRADGQFEKRVAIKLIQSASADDPLHRRFLAERQILAGLEHPDIARLLDGGITDDGRPYLVLEYVDGLPITEYCDRHRLAVEDRLRLFIRVCDAVQYAHRNLIIHRDLKPGNILVTETGEVRLLDFGIAKLIQPKEGTRAAPLTRAEFRLLTPGYASPEQVRGDPLTTASDVYSLGVLLYELMTGCSPYPKVPGSTADLIEMVCLRDPERPSARSVRGEVFGGAWDQEDPSESAGELAPRERSVRRGTTPERLRRRLRGDLDSIVLMALRKEPALRYASCDLLRQDIEAHLADLPVRAHRGSRRYRMGRFMRRYRVETAAAALIAVSLVGGTAAATWQAVVAGREQARAEAERAKAEEVAAFLEGLFAAVDPYAPSAERLDTLRVRELLSRGAERVRGGLADQPDVRAQMLDVVGRVYGSLGLFEDAIPLLEEALEVRRGLLPRSADELALTLDHFGRLLTETGDLERGEAMLREALQIRRASRSTDLAATATNLNAVANALRARGRFVEAEEYHLSAIQTLRSGGEVHVPVLAEVLTDLVATHEVQGDYEAAEARAREAVDLHLTVYGPMHPRLALAMGQLGLLLQRRAAYPEAEALFQQAYAITGAALGEEHPRSAELLGRLASARRWQRDYEAADSLNRKAISLQRKLYGDRHPEVANSLNNLASVLRQKQDYAAAVPIHEEAIEITRGSLGEDHAFYWIHRGNLAMTLTASGACEAAIPLHREVIVGLQRTIPREAVRVHLQESWLGQCLGRTGRFAEAEALLLTAHAALVQRGEDDEFVLEAAERLADLYAAWGRPEEERRWRP
jgi:eukaryotic-like serine/threonine-protein kinase